MLSLLARSCQMLVASVLLYLIFSFIPLTHAAQRASGAAGTTSQYLPLVLQQQEEPEIPPAQRIPLLMGMPPLYEICNYEVISLRRDTLLPAGGNFNSAPLEEAHTCGTKIIVRLEGLSSDVAKPTGGLDLVVYEDRINDFVGLIDPYVENGTIISHLTIDEPHDCSDWNGVCPTQAEVDQASAISKRYWPTLHTIVNAAPLYASTYTWVETDELAFTYAFHKGTVADFIADGRALLDAGKVRSLSWAMQVVEGGCDTYGTCSMTPQQVLEVGTAICDTGSGSFVGFFRYDAAVLTEEMHQSIEELRMYCTAP